MKKLLLFAVAACTVFGASAALADLTRVWQNPVNNTVASDSRVFNAPVAVDASGNVIATGAFTEDFSVAGSSLEAIGTSAYVIKYDKAGTALWAVAFTGAASVSAIDTDASGNIYLAGTFADEVEFGSTDGQSVVKEGMKIDGAFTTKQNASFIAKYDANGALTAVQAFVPEPLPALVETGMYYTEDGAVFFRINHLRVDGDGVYVSAVYTGRTSIGDAALEGSYNDPWGGIYFIDLRSCAVIEMDSDLVGAKSVVECGVESPLATEDSAFYPGSVAFTVDNGSVYAVFSGNGPLQLKTANEAKNVDAEQSEYDYSFVVVKDGSIGQLYSVACPESGASEVYMPVDVAVAEETIYVVGYEDFAENYGEDNERLGNELFVFTAPVDNISGAQKSVKEFAEGSVTYYEIVSSAVLSSGEIYINALGYYNATDGDHKNNDFAGAVKSYVFANGGFAAASTVGDAVGVASEGAYVAFSQINDSGVTYSLYNDEAYSGISDIAVDDENAPVEYFNLQGIRVDNPDSGLYIRRQGGTTAKVLVK